VGSDACESTSDHYRCHYWIIFSHNTSKTTKSPRADGNTAKFVKRTPELTAIVISLFDNSKSISAAGITSNKIQLLTAIGENFHFRRDHISHEESLSTHQVCSDSGAHGHFAPIDFWTSNV
jgi:hypothetical protein